MMRRLILVAACAGCCGCLVGPNYRRPPVSVPDTFRGPGGQPAATPGSLADLRWWEVFQDAELQSLLGTALTNNYDINIAAARVEQAAANVGIVRSNPLPQVAATAEASRSRSSGAAIPFIAGLPSVTSNFLSVTPAVSWALDFWGQYRRANQAARANLLASEAGRQAVRTSIVAATASAYFQLRELDMELAITHQTLATRRDSLQLTQIRERGGVASMLDVRQAESLVAGATAVIPVLQRQIEQTENAIGTLLGENPRAIARGRPLDQQSFPATPAGLPSSLLARRPDIQAAEQTLIAANAQIGVARAAYFPAVNLSAYIGFQSTNFENLVSGSGWVWGVSPLVSLPIFTAGRIRSTVALSQAQRQEALLVYRQTILRAFREVSDALIALTRNREFRIQQEALTMIYRDAARLSEVRYRGGVTTYLEVLDSERNVYVAELERARAQLNELNAVVQLYNSLGGGWQ